jgi:hypothetical protein
LTEMPSRGHVKCITLRRSSVSKYLLCHRLLIGPPHCCHAVASPVLVPCYTDVSPVTTFTAFYLRPSLFLQHHLSCSQAMHSCFSPFVSLTIILTATYSRPNPSLSVLLFMICMWLSRSCTASKHFYPSCDFLMRQLSDSCHIVFV